MIMTLNELLTKQNVITKIEFKSGNKELSKELKIKIMRIRMFYNKIKKQFDEDVQEFVNQLVTPEFKALAEKEEKTEQEKELIEKTNKTLNQEYQEFLTQKGLEEVNTLIDDSITFEEYCDILDINSETESTINGIKVSGPDLMEVFLELFVKEDIK